MNELELVLKIGVALTAEKDLNKLLDLILLESMKVSHADAGTIYLCKETELEFKITRNNTLGVYEGGDGGPSKLPPVQKKEENVCAYAAIHNQTVKIDDLDQATEFDFTGPRKYEKITGYRTKSMYVVPLVDVEGTVIAVMQLLNAQDKKGQAMAFQEKDLKVLQAVASQASVAITNAEYIQDTKQMIYSFVQVFMTMFEKQTAYNGHHTKNMVFYMEELVDYINEQYRRGKIGHHISKEAKEELLLSTWLHDVGKIVTPIEILDKATRLEENLNKIMHRLDYILAMKKIARLEGSILEEAWQKDKQQIQLAKLHIQEMNTKSFLTEEDMKLSKEIAKESYIDIHGEVQNWLEPAELDALMIQRGTLTAKERKIVEEHVVHTETMLEQIKFPKYFKHITKWASQHHECLNGKGYPRGIKADELCFESRMLAVIDIFEALTAKDRPYKSVLPKEMVFRILFEKVAAGDLDAEIVQFLQEMVEEKGILPG